ncbi:AAA family ATPase [bacterium]|nr:AAA family ATPase [bacterium]
MKKKLLIGAVGMAGSGKTEIIKYLQSQWTWPKVYFGEPVFERLRKEGRELNYENEKIIREKMRDELGMGVMAKLCLPKINKAFEDSEIVLIESLYSWEEYKILKTAFSDNFKVIAAYASPQTRFKRLINRANERPIKSIKEFTRRDYTEIEGTDKGGPIARADFTIINETDLKHLHQELNKIINNLTK